MFEKYLLRLKKKILVPYQMILILNLKTIELLYASLNLILIITVFFIFP